MSILHFIDLLHIISYNQAKSILCHKKESVPLFSNKDLRRLLIPLILEQLLSGFMGITDTLMVGRVGDTALSAVSCVDAINTLVLYLLSALASGGTIICAQFLGRKQREHAISAAKQVYLLSFSVSLLVAAICIPFRLPLLRLIFGQVEPSIMTQAQDYFLITAISYPFLALQQTSAAQFRAGGEAKLPMLVTALANVVNVGGNALFIFGFQMGVAGAALSTLLCRILNAVILILCQRKDSHVIAVRGYCTIRPDGRLLLNILRIALPNGAEYALFQLGRLLVQSTVATLGTAAIAAQAMTGTLDTIGSVPGMAVGIGTLTVVGQCMGAGRVEEAKYYTRKLCLISWCCVMVFTLFILAVSNPVCRLGGLSADAAALTVRLLIYITIAKALFWIPAFTLPNTLRASGDVAYTAVVSVVSMWCFRVFLSAILCRFLGFGLEGVWLPWFIDWICRLSFYIARYRSGKWQHKRVL